MNEVSNAVTFRFQDGTSTIFSVTNNVSSLDADTIRDKHYTYNNINYHIPSEFRMNCQRVH